jgi:hypothetical protein
MASIREPPQLLEPSNLLEPLDLTEQQLDFVYPLTRPQTDENKGFGRTTAGAPVLRASESERRSPLKSLLIVAGAVACFGAGTVFPQLHSLTRGDLGPGSIIGSTSQPSSPIAEGATKLEEGPALNTIAGARAASFDEGGASAVAQPGQAAPHAQPASAAKDALADCAAPCNQQACPKDDANCLEGGPLSPAKELTTTDGSAAYPAAGAQPVRRTATPQSADSERAQTRASARQDERASHRSKRAVQRERAHQQAVAKRNAATGTRWSRVEAPGVEWRRDWTGGRWQERDADRAWNWRRDRYDQYDRDGDRRFKAARDGDFQMGRAERREGPLMMMLPPARYP